MSVGTLRALTNRQTEAQEARVAGAERGITGVVMLDIRITRQRRIAEVDATRLGVVKAKGPGTVGARPVR
jgi:hypothetical protein